MREDELRDLFAAAGAQRPPAGRIDPDEIIHTGQRIRRRRRRLAELGSGVATAGVAALAVVLLQAGGTSTEPAGPATNVPTTSHDPGPSPSPTPEPSIAPPPTATVPQSPDPFPPMTPNPSPTPAPGAEPDQTPPGAGAPGAEPPPATTPASPAAPLD